MKKIKTLMVIIVNFPNSRAKLKGGSPSKIFENNFLVNYTNSLAYMSILKISSKTI